MGNGAYKILVVEDEPDIRKLVHYNLAQDHYKVLEAESGDQALKLIHRDKPSLVILDLMMPGMSGLEVCRVLRGQDETAKLPILMLTAKAGEADRVLGLELGADDYLAKPFSPRELVARVRAILRRANGAGRTETLPAYQKGGLKIDFATYEVSVRGKPIKLTLKEFELLKFLVAESQPSAQPRSTPRSRLGRRNLRHPAHRRRAYSPLAQGDRKRR